ncbi:class I SAM-dependent methyltransferase [Lacimicrobium sp. SS2-24]|uniref:class I SAM-dependent methyltransferase n=1 Tax=Lacimicrobium sp. SS2-24 TaxID=2005569 RepID=UPI000B4AEC25|nr:class I SAM-dependent methyltransferase [Lacimicrobium sp. SS2-24]
MQKLKALCGLGATILISVSPLTQANELQQAVMSEHRTPIYQARDEYRNPQQTLRFFDVQPDMTVVEISPGGGWYTEILAPYLKDNGKLIAAHFDPNSDVDYYQRSYKNFMQKIADNQDVYGKVEVSVFQPPEKLDFAPPGSADRVLTFRNVHNWYMRGQGEENLNKVFSAFYDALKPGGVLGVVEHRLPADRPAEDMEKSGYMHEKVVINAALHAGFKLAGSSDINANSRDTANHPKGVWTLPPRLALEDEKRAHYLAIGESDRMTLKFVKPAEK